MAFSYNPAAWYWIVAGSTSQVWNSAAVEYVAVNDQTYVAWLSSGGMPTKIANATELVQVLLQQWAPLVQASGLQVSSIGTPALNGTYAIDSASQAQITSLSTGIAAGKPLPGGGSTFNYPDITGGQHAFNATNFLDFAASIEGYIYNFNQALIASVNGTPTALPSTTLTIA